MSENNLLNDKGEKTTQHRHSGGAMVAAAVVSNDTPKFWCDYRRSLRLFPGESSTSTKVRAGNLTMSFTMPEKIRTKSRISLWHFLFELHNGRIFRDLLGRYTWLIVPLGGLALLLTIISTALLRGS